MAESVLVTGATGLVGAALARRFAGDGLRVVAAVRNVAKAHALFDGLAGVEVCEWDVTRPFDLAVLDPSARHLDWLVHAAAETSTRNFVEKPVETTSSILDGTRNALELARAARVGSMVYLSSMEVYGAPTTETVTEADIGYLDPVRLRSNYPEAKRMAENLCVSYAKEYGVPVKIARLAQTFGEGVRAEDARVYAQFARAILDGRDLVLKTDGSSSRCYCYLGDAVEAVRILLERGADATPYTVANEATFCSVREMAERLVAAYPESGSRLVFDVSEEAARSYPPPSRLKLDSSRLRALGWEPKVGLMEAFRRMMGGMRKIVLAAACLFAVASEATQHALVVGINEYTNPGCDTLAGCITDANRMRSLLLDCGGGWQPEDVTVLTNAAASRSAILAAMQGFAKKAASGDTFVYAHSGHGGNQALCAADQDISADDLGACLNSFPGGVTVLCVIDACHAGSMPSDGGKSRSVKKGGGRAPMDFASFVADVENAMRGVAAKGKLAAPKSGTAKVGWCVAVDAVNSSWDLGSAFGGLFTYPFIQSARSGAADATCFSCQGVDMSYGNGDGVCTAEEAFWSAYNTALVWSERWQTPQIYNGDVCAKVVLAKSCPVDINVAADTDLHLDSYAYDSANLCIEGGVGFFGQTTTSYDGSSALACSPVLPSQVCVLETSVTVAASGVISFRWKTSSDLAPEARHLRLLVDGRPVVMHSGDEWLQATVAISGEGRHTVRWEYYVTRKDMAVGDMADENCAYIDTIEWRESAPGSVVLDVGSSEPASDAAADCPGLYGEDDTFLLDFDDPGVFHGKGTYSGYVLQGRGMHGAAGAVVGLVTLKVARPKEDGRCDVTAVVTVMGRGKTVRMKGVAAPDPDYGAWVFTAALSGGAAAAELAFLHKNAWGWIDLDGVRCWCDLSRIDAHSAAVAAVRGNYILGAYSRGGSGDSYVGLSLRVRAKGIAWFSGVLPDGNRISGRTMVVVDDFGVYVPIFARVNANRGSFCGFIVDVAHGRLALDAVGHWNLSGAGSNAQAELVFDVFEKVGDAPPSSENRLFESFGSFPQSTVVKFDGRKWTQTTPAGERLSLAYRPRTGTVHGNFSHVMADGRRQRFSCDGIYTRGSSHGGMVMMTLSAKGKPPTYAIVR